MRGKDHVIHLGNPTTGISRSKRRITVLDIFTVTLFKVSDCSRDFRQRGKQSNVSFKPDQVPSYSLPKMHSHAESTLPFASMLSVCQQAFKSRVKYPSGRPVINGFCKITAIALGRAALQKVCSVCGACLAARGWTRGLLCAVRLTEFVRGANRVM